MNERPEALMTEDGSRALTRPGRAPTLIRLGSRLGVWGLVGGFGSMTAFTLGAPISLGAAIGLMGAGLLVSGAGLCMASAAALRRVAPDRRLLRVTALIGVPTGSLLAVLGTTSLLQWGPLVRIVNAVTPTAAVLGALMIVLLVVAFVGQWRRDDGAEP